MELGTRQELAHSLNMIQIQEGPTPEKFLFYLGGGYRHSFDACCLLGPSKMLYIQYLYPYSPLGLTLLLFPLYR